MVASVQSLLPPLLRVAQPLCHLLVFRSDRCPTHRGSVPAIVVDRHVDAAVDKELHGFVIRMPYELMQNAGGLMRAPVRIDRGPRREKKVADLEMVVPNRPGKRGVANLLPTGLAPV